MLLAKTLLKLFKAISALIALYEATPEDLKETKPVRYAFTSAENFALFNTTYSEVDNDKVSDIISRGDQLYEAMYGNTAKSVQSLLDAIHPDMGMLLFFLLSSSLYLIYYHLGWFSKAIGYGHVYNFPHILNQRDTSYAIVAALIAMDTPRQVGWHLANCRRGGASRQEVYAIREISMRVASVSGIKWRDGVPEVQEEV